MDLQMQLDECSLANYAAGDIGDDGFGSQIILGNYLDDGGLIVPHGDPHLIYFNNLHT
jgi:hypothetical protein